VIASIKVVNDRSYIDACDIRRVDLSDERSEERLIDIPDT
jgi:hypothetical protein